MTVDFRANNRSQLNPFWLLWPKGQTHHRHAPDFSSEDATDRLSCRRQLAADRLREKDRLQHQRTRDVLSRSWTEYEEFTTIDKTAGTQPTSAMRLPPSAVRAVSRSTICYRDLREAIGAQRRTVRPADRQRLGRC